MLRYVVPTSPAHRYWLQTHLGLQMHCPKVAARKRPKQQNKKKIRKHSQYQYQHPETETAKWNSAIFFMLFPLWHVYMSLVEEPIAWLDLDW